MVFLVKVGHLVVNICGGDSLQGHVMKISRVTVFVMYKHRRTGRGGARGAAAPPKFWATQFFWAARENLGKASF